MESSEWLVLHDQMSDGDGFGNAIFRNLAIPLAHDFIPCQTLIQLFENDPRHDARVLERGLPATDFGIRDDMPSEFDPAALSICLRFHADAPNYVLGPIRLQADDAQSHAGDTQQLEDRVPHANWQRPNGELLPLVQTSSRLLTGFWREGISGALLVMAHPYR